MIVRNNYCTYTISGKYSLNTFDCLDNYMWLQRVLAITKAHLRLCYSARRNSSLFFEFANSKVMFTWRVHWFISEIKAGHWFISWYIFTNWISDYCTDSGLESRVNQKIKGAARRNILVNCICESIFKKILRWINSMIFGIMKKWMPGLFHWKAVFTNLQMLYKLYYTLICSNWIVTLNNSMIDAT